MKHSLGLARFDMKHNSMKHSNKQSSICSHLDSHFTPPVLNDCGIIKAVKRCDYKCAHIYRTKIPYLAGVTTSICAEE